MADQPESTVFRGSLRADWFTAQLGVTLTISENALLLRAPGREIRIDREQFQGWRTTSILGIFKRGVRFSHRQSELPKLIAFYPSGNREEICTTLQNFDWMPFEG